MKHTSIKIPNSVEIIKMEPLKYSPLISKCQIKVCYVGDEPNRNKSIITKEAALDMAPSLRGCPIVGLYDASTGDFEEHSRELDFNEDGVVFKDITRPYGFVDLNAQVWFEKYLDDNSVEHEYMVTEGWIWTQYDEAKRIIEKGNNQSMELDENSLKATWTNGNKEEPSFFIINEAVISKLCVLGEEFEPCFEGANIKGVEYSMNDQEFKFQLLSMMQEIKDYFENNKEGGTQVEQELINEIIEETVVDAADKVVEPVEENDSPDVEVASEYKVEEVNENKDEEDKSDDSEIEDIVEDVSEEVVAEPEKNYILEEVTEYLELSTKYSDLQAEFESIKAERDALVAEIAPLKEFKHAAELEKKVSMINSFYMLSDEEKAEVSENIEKYSLDEIEAKLSIICVRNKVSFGLEDSKNEESAPVTFNLGSVSPSAAESSTPAWVKAALKKAKEI